MKKLLLPLLLLVAISFGCKEDEEPELICGTADPVADLPWLAFLTDEINESYEGVYFYVVRTIYEDQTVFVLQNCCPLCNSVPVVYSCTGEQLGFISANAGINPAILDNAQLVWKADFAACTF